MKGSLGGPILDCLRETEAPSAGGGDNGRGISDRTEVDPLRREEEAWFSVVWSGWEAVLLGPSFRLLTGESASGVKARAAARIDGLRRAGFRSDAGGGGMSDGSSSGGVSEEF